MNFMKIALIIQVVIWKKCIGLIKNISSKQLTEYAKRKAGGQNMNSTFQGMKYHAPKTASSFSSHGGFHHIF